MPIGRVYSAPEVLLNENLQLKDLLANERVAFYGLVRNVTLLRYTELYKFTSGVLKGGAGRITPWWSPTNPFEMDAGLEARLSLARRLGVHASDLTRSYAAVSEEFNQLQFILKARLKRSVHALWGQCATMPRQGGEIAQGKEIPPEQQGSGIAVSGGRVMNIRTPMLPGKAWQFNIPNLTDEHIEQVSRMLVPFP